jgi:hypothetical protein
MHVLFGLSALIFAAGLTAFSARLVPKLRARTRSRTAAQTMARGLRNSIRRENARTAVAALRLKCCGDLQTLPDEAVRAELLRRIVRIQAQAAELSGTRPPAGRPECMPATTPAPLHALPVERRTCMQAGAAELLIGET